MLLGLKGEEGERERMEDGELPPSSMYRQARKWHPDRRGHSTAVGQIQQRQTRLPPSPPRLLSPDTLYRLPPFSSAPWRNMDPSYVLFPVKHQTPGPTRQGGTGHGAGTKYRGPAVQKAAGAGFV